MKLEDMINQVIQGDCLEVMKQLPDKCIDLVLTDPPYGIELEYDGYKDTSDNLQDTIDNIFPELLRVSKRIAITCGVGNIWKYPPADWVLCWNWTNTSSTGKWGFNCWQPILVYGKDPKLVAGLGRHQDTRQFKPRDGKPQEINHPCPKPIEVMNWLVDRCSLQGETILDCFTGS